VTAIVPPGPARHVVRGGELGHDSASGFRAWTGVAVLLLLNVVALLDRQIISLLVGPIKADLGISNAQIGLLQGFAFALLYCFAAIPIGWAVDRISRRLVIFVGVFVWGLATVASGLAQSFGALLAARILVGLGEAALAPAAFSILSDLFDRHRLGLVLSIYSMGSVLGAACALAIGTIATATLKDGIDLPLVGQLAVWQSVLVVVGAPGLLLAFLVFAMPEPSRRLGRQEEADFAALGRFARHNARFLAGHMAGFGFLIAIAYGTLAWLPTIMQRSFGLSLGATGATLASIIAVTGIGGNLLNGALVDRLFARGHTDAHLCYYAGASIAVAVFAGGSLLAGSAVSFLILFVPVMLFANLYGVAAAAIQIATPARLRGKMSAIYLLVINLFGMIVGPSGVALVGDYLVGSEHLNLALGGLAVILAVLAAVSFKSGLAPMRRAVADADGRC